jgi:hypothetical protein
VLDVAFADLRPRIHCSAITAFERRRSHSVDDFGRRISRSRPVTRRGVLALHYPSSTNASVTRADPAGALFSDCGTLYYPSYGDVAAGKRTVIPPL